MAMLALLLLFPLLWPFAAKAIFGHDYTLPEMMANIGISVVLVAGVWGMGHYAQTADTEILNGQVTSKNSERVSCGHSYQCMCIESCSGSGSSRSCTTICQTCYDHPYDVSWNVLTDVGNFTIDRINSQGTKMPPRWNIVKVGDPVAVDHSYKNYIKAAPDSLFSAVAEKTALARYGDLVPAYPLKIYDYHYLDRVIAQGVAVADLAAWNKDLANRLRTAGPLKQVNWVVLLTNSADPAYADAVRVKWLGGKKNDVIVVLGAPEYPKLAWTRIVSWTDKELFKVQLRDDLLKLEALDHTAVFDLLEKHSGESFVRKNMADFEYLSNEIEPPTWVLIMAGLLGVLSSLGLSIYFAKNDTF